ncbi:hypothetical protein [Porphyrobacter sp. AAP82]|uniref:hypothetical protein n=1 Tax=Porphyrobacter sp. AAP82 TaxID=1248917 RepID=UPI0012DC52BB|nr:hypothetical protein [Porphyrobacter sp. AAP82]
MGLLFLALTFLAGLTVGTVEIALINLVVFLVCALIATRILEPQWGRNGLVFGMAGAFFISVLWPAVAFGLRGGDCESSDCDEQQPTVKIYKQVAQ